MASVLVCLLLCFVLSGCRNAEPVATAQPAGQQAADTDALIAYYKDKIAKSDKHYPSYALLADALLRKAKETGDPAYLAEARSSGESSIKIQPNYTAMTTMAMIANYTHRFAEAVAWADKAATATGEGVERDSHLTAIYVEAFVGLGEIEKAAAVLERYTDVGKKAEDFYIASARGALLKAEAKPDEAAQAFGSAAEYAAKQNARELIVWSHAMQAGCMIDAGRAAEAEPFLEMGRAIYPNDKLIKIHEAEYLAATGRAAEALATYEDLLKSSHDPELHHRAYVLSRDLGKAPLAEQHFAAAEKGFTDILAAGEIYTLGPSAQLYCDQGVDLEKARSFALRNLEYKRDAEAQRTMQCVNDKAARAAG